MLYLAALFSITLGPPGFWGLSFVDVFILQVGEMPATSENWCGWAVAPEQPQQREYPG